MKTKERSLILELIPSSNKTSYTIKNSHNFYFCRNGVESVCNLSMYDDICPVKIKVSTRYFPGSEEIKIFSLVKKPITYYHIYITYSANRTITTVIPKSWGDRLGIKTNKNFHMAVI